MLPHRINFNLDLQQIRDRILSKHARRKYVHLLRELDVLCRDVSKIASAPGQLQPCLATDLGSDRSKVHIGDITMFYKVHMCCLSFGLKLLRPRITFSLDLQRIWDPFFSKCAYRKYAHVLQKLYVLFVFWTKSCFSFQSDSALICNRFEIGVVPRHVHIGYMSMCYSICTFVFSYKFCLGLGSASALT